MSPFMVLTLVSGLAVAAVTVLVIVVMGIRSERRRYQMSTKPHGVLDAFVRRLLGVYVSSPADAEDTDEREECLTGNSTDWWNNGRLGE